MMPDLEPTCFNSNVKERYLVSNTIDITDQIGSEFNCRGSGAPRERVATWLSTFCTFELSHIFRANDTES